ncbi:unnamed protein product, partial [Sphacelaria rigidula]
MTRGFSAPGMTNQMCAGYCGADGFAYSGTQYGFECWCGNSSDYDKHGSSSRCTSPCAGEPTTSCGGKFAMTVSDTAGYVPLPPTPAPTGAPTSPTPANTIGCFKDHRLNRIMTSKAFSSSDMTNEKCGLYCMANDFTYSGTQYFTECWCSNSPDYDKHGASSRCTTPCSGGASSEYCGGDYAMTVSK